MKLGGFVIRPGMRVGLLGGSFDPAHEGHLHVSTEALKRFDLDAVVWIFSPGNPLKPNAPEPMAARMDRARPLVRHPRIGLSDIEQRIETRYTVQTLAFLQKRYPAAHFVWIMGADNLVGFHKWDQWRDIASRVPLAVLARPGQRLAAKTSRVARILRAARLPAVEAPRMAFAQAPAWCFVNMPMVNISSSAIRAQQRDDRQS